MKKLLKAMHLLGALVFGGTLVAGLGMTALALRSGAPESALLTDAARSGAAVLLLPALLLTIVSGLLSVAVHRPFMEAPWVWLKALLGMLIASTTLFGLQPAIERLQLLAHRASMASGIDLDWPAALAGLRALGVGTLGLAVLAVVLGVWRPRHIRVAPLRRRG